MMIDERKKELMQVSRTWLVTGAAGFIGSNLVEALLRLGQNVRGIDNFATGRRENLVSVRTAVGEDAWKRFSFVEGDINDLEQCRNICKGVCHVLHQAAVVSVPRSFREPILSLQTNILGFLNILLAAQEMEVERFVFASSSSVYGNSQELPKVEERIGTPLSPYALAKQSDELLAKMLCGSGKTRSVGLRYFNVFGPRQNAAGEYAAVIPRFIDCMIAHRSPVIFGDGETSRDFCYIDNVVQANLLASLSEEDKIANQVFNIAFGGRTTLNEVFRLIRTIVAQRTGDREVLSIEPRYEPFRAGDIPHSHANIALAKKTLDYSPEIDVRRGLEMLTDWTLNAHQ